MKSNDPRLVETTEALAPLEEEFRAFARELGEDCTHIFNPELLEKDFRGYLRYLENHSKGIDLPEGWIPGTTYWYLTPDDKLIGKSNLRHRLVPKLEDVGGHIGYVIRPSFRKMGYGRRILALTLEKAREMTLDRVMVTADSNNIYSRKIIEKNGGVLASESISQVDGISKARYWIDLRQTNLNLA